MKWARQRDANEPAIVHALQLVGASVTKLNATGCPDLLVGWRGVNTLLEVKQRTATGLAKRTGRKKSEAKTDARGLLETQQRWWAAWKGAPPTVVTSAEEALAAIGWTNDKETAT